MCAQAEDSPRTQRCSKCGETKPNSEFWRQSAAPSGLQRYCKPCKRSVRGDRPAKRPLGLPSDVKWCRLCETVKPVEAFGWTQQAKGRRRSECTECRRVKDRRLTYAEIGEKRCPDCHIVKALSSYHLHDGKPAHRCRPCARAHSQREREARPEFFQRRHRIAGWRRRGIVDIEWCEVIRLDVCAYCGGPAGAVDHIDNDLAQGTWENLAGACMACNSAKNTKPLLTFLLDRVAA
jgi:hypothetical protein